MFDKVRSVKVSERVFDLVCEALNNEQYENGAKINGYLECFCNCREQGYVMTVYSTDWDAKDRPRDLRIWACEARSSDEIMVVWGTEDPEPNNLFGEAAYGNRKYFHFDELQKAADYIVGLVKEKF